MYAESKDLPMYCPYNSGIVQWVEDVDGGY